MNKPAQNQVEIIWLRYFNETAFRAGLITQKERDLLHLRIQTRHPKHTGKQRPDATPAKGT